MPAQTMETFTVLEESNETFDLMIGDLEQEIPELLDMANSHVGTTPIGCLDCTCIEIYCS